MSEPEGFKPEGFLARWSRRKQDAADGAVKPSPVHDDVAQPNQSAADDPATSAAQPAPAVVADAPFDPATLPPIDSIEAGSDIRAFLQRGVPTDLSRAALRRAWSADPAIRDFVGLSENAWNFNEPASIPGFAPRLAAEDVRRLLGQVVPDDQGRDAEAPAQLPGAQAQPVDEPEDSTLVTDQAEAADKPVPGASLTEPEVPGAGEAIVPNREKNPASRETTDGDDVRSPLVRRAHGGALPR